MPSAELLERLARLEQRAWEQTLRSEPSRAVYFRQLPVGEEPRLMELWTADQELTSAEATALYTCLAEARVVDLKPNAEPELRWWIPAEISLVIAFHRFARSNRSLNIPFLYDLLKGYLFATISGLFQKYGWKAAQPDFAELRPLDEWAPEDRNRIIAMLDQICTAFDAANVE